jgi:SEC-C motif-containing protein
MNEQALCPCGSGLSLDDCCGCYIAGMTAQTAEQLMRSRYTAYVFKNNAYLFATWHVRTRPELLEEDNAKWLGLKIINYQQHDNTHAIVEFVARYKIAGRAYRLHEISQFVFEEGRWFYLDGVLR